MKHHTIIGGGGTRLHLVEAGDPRGPSILFLHGCSQSWLTWDRQMRSELARRYRLVAMDLRGHGSSERPRDGYDDSRLWAADVDAAIRELELDRPILCGWSYGPLVILDYIRHYGEERIGGIHLVGAVTKLGSEAAAAVLSAEFLALLPGLFSSDVGEAVRGLRVSAAPVLRPRAGGVGSVHHAGLQRVRAAVRPSGAADARRRQRRPPADHREARIDHAWRARRGRQAGGRRATPRGAAARAD